MTVVADQQGQAVGLARIIGMISRREGAILAPGKSSHGAPCQRLSQRVCCQCRNMKANYLNLPPFIHPGGRGVEGKPGSGLPAPMVWFSRGLQLGAKVHHLPHDHPSTGLWPRQGTGGLLQPLPAGRDGPAGALHPATTRPPGDPRAPAASSPCRIWAARSSPMQNTRGMAGPGQPCQPRIVPSSIK